MGERPGRSNGQSLPADRELLVLVFPETSDLLVFSDVGKYLAFPT